MSDLPVVVIGAGPLGLAAAAHLLERGLEPLVLESGLGRRRRWPSGGTSGCSRRGPSWSTRRLRGCSEPTGWTAPETGYPTGAEWIDGYLAPLAKALGDRVRYDARVTGVSRKGRDRLVDADRAEQPFTVHLADAEGNESRLEARAVIDASGTWRRPNPAGADGLPALGERAAADLIAYQVPNRADPARYAGKHTVVVGAGDSAFNAIHELVQIAADHPGTSITWAIRRAVGSGTFGGGAADELPERGALGQRAKRAVESGVGRAGHRFPGRADPPRDGRRRSRRGGWPGAACGRHRGGAHRVPSGPVLPVRDATRPRPHAGGPAEDRGRDRPEHPLLRLGAGHRRGRPGAART